MNKTIESITKFATIFESKAQVLPLGTSTIGKRDVQAKMEFYKKEILANRPDTPWFKRLFAEPGDVALELIDKILNGGVPDEELKQGAKSDIETNFPTINVNEFMRYVNAYV